MIASPSLLTIVALAILLWLLFSVLPLREDLRNLLAVIIAIVIVWLILGMLGVL